MSTVAAGGEMRFRVYGVTIATTYDLSRYLPYAADDGREPDLTFGCVTIPSVIGTQGRVVFDRHGITITRHPDEDTISFDGSTVHRVQADAIVCHLLDPDHEFLVPIQLLGMVMALWLEAHGRIVLHASAVDIGGQAVVFVAGGKAGKTSLAAAFTALGDAMITEDLAAVTGGDGFTIHPGYPMVRMWPETALHFTGTSSGFDIYHPSFDKVWVPINRLGAFVGRSRPLSRIYLPERRQDGPVEVEPLAPLDALRAVMTGSFLADMIEPAPDVGERFRSLGDLVEAVPVRSLAFPAGFHNLGAVRAKVVADLAL